MRLQTLAGLERKKIEDELKEKLALIEELEAILGNPQRILEIIKEELAKLKEKYGDKRKTKVIKGQVGEFSQEDLVANEETIISLTEDGYIKRLSPDTFRTQKRGGKGVLGGAIKQGDAVDKVLSAMTHDDLLFFTNTGKVFKTKAYEIPVSTRTAKGNAIVNFLQISPEEKITSVMAISQKTQAKHLVMQTTQGKIKKTPLKDFENVRRTGLIAISLNEKDSLGWVDTSTGEDEVVIVTKNGQSIRFSEKNVRPMGRSAAGVKAIKMKKEDEVVAMQILRQNAASPQLLVITEKGYGKRTDLKKYKAQTRGGSGIKTASLTQKTGKLISGHIIEENDQTQDLIVSSNRGQIIRTSIENISLLGRSTQGVRVMRLKENERLAATTVV
jgi:DNA gyrase subunit A